MFYLSATPYVLTFREIPKDQNFSCLQDSGSTHVSEHTLLQVADILSVIASSCHGRQHILYGESGEKFSRSK